MEIRAKGRFWNLCACYMDLQSENGHHSGLWNLVIYVVIGPLVTRFPRQDKAVGKLAQGVHRKGVSIVVF